MRMLTMKECGNGQSHWTLKPSEGDIAKVNEIVANAVANIGLDCSFSVSYDESTPQCYILGYNPIKVSIHINNAPNAVRLRNGNLVVGVSKITADFHCKATMLSYDDYRLVRRQEENELFSKLPMEEAREAISALPWDGKTFEFRGNTNGKTRNYRCRTFYHYECARSITAKHYKYLHFQYANSWDILKEMFATYIEGIALEMGIAYKKDYTLKTA